MVAATPQCIRHVFCAYLLKCLIVCGVRCDK